MGCAVEVRGPLNSVKADSTGSDASATVHKSLRESDAPGQPKSLRNRRFCRVSSTCRTHVLDGTNQRQRCEVPSKETSESSFGSVMRFSRLRAEGKRKSGRTGTEFHGELWLVAAE